MSLHCLRKFVFIILIIFGLYHFCVCMVWGSSVFFRSVRIKLSERIYRWIPHFYFRCLYTSLKYIFMHMHFKWMRPIVVTLGKLLLIMFFITMQLIPKVLNLKIIFTVGGSYCSCLILDHIEHFFSVTLSSMLYSMSSHRAVITLIQPVPFTWLWQCWWHL